MSNKASELSVPCMSCRTQLFWEISAISRTSCIYLLGCLPTVGTMIAHRLRQQRARTCLNIRQSVQQQLDCLPMMQTYESIPCLHLLLSCCVLLAINPRTGSGALTNRYSTSCHGGTDSCGVLRDVACDADGGSVSNPFFDHTACNGSLVANCNGHLICQSDECICPVNKATGSFSETCSGCRDVCGILHGCHCGGLQLTQQYFDYSVCNGSVVADCFGALLCQGEPCA